MNLEPDMPDPRDLDSGPVEERGRLAEIERRLKAAQPRPPSLDPLALLRIASGGEVESVSWRRSDVSDRSGGSDRSDRSEHIPVVRPTRANGFWSAVAGSWICGAVVGVLVTLMLVSRPAPVVENAIVRQEIRVPEPAEAIEAVEGTSVPQAEVEIGLEPAPVAPVLPAARQTRGETMMAMIADPRGGWQSDVWMHGGVLRAGMLYRPAAGPLWDSPQEAWDMDKPDIDRPELPAPDARRTIDFEPPPPMTRGKLMEQLIREAARHGVL
jgi:hypothetical protein